MPGEPSTGQIALLVIAIALFAIGGILSLMRLRRPPGETLRIASKACLYLGATISLCVLIWHAVKRDNWLPLGDNFDALVWLGVLLSLFVLYVQRRRPLAGLEWFVMPIVILLLVGAVVFGRTKPHEYVDSTWAWVHRVTAYGGTLAFAIAGVVGMMYLINLRRIRGKSALSGAPSVGASLERLEHLTTTSVTLGFALLTVGVITGIAEVIHGHRAPLPKILLGLAVWIVYGIVLHAPINPSFRGRKAAVLSVVGFALTICTILAIMLLPPGNAAHAAGGAH
jgi:ABC-type uncharacterized transport system permease subunit